MMYIPVYSVCK